MEPRDGPAHHRLGGRADLTRSLTAERGGGVAEAARLVLGMGAERAGKARVAYRLYSLAERKRWTDEAHAYNILVTSWPQIRAEAIRLAAGVPEQAGLEFSGGKHRDETSFPGELYVPISVVEGCNVVLW